MMRQGILPAGWAAEYLGNLDVEIFDGPFGSHLKTSDYVDSGIRVIRLENIGHGRFIDEKQSFISEEKYGDIRKHTVVPGDIVFSSFVTESIRSALVPTHIPFAVNKADCFAIRFFGKTTSAKFVQLFFQSRAAFKQIEGMTHGVGRPRINTSQLKQLVVPLAPKREQVRIIAKIEELFSELDKGIESLKAAREQLKVYRQAVLSDAFKGNLTSDWRKRNCDTLLSFRDLQDTFRVEQKAQHAYELEKWNTSLQQRESRGAGRSTSRPEPPANAAVLSQDAQLGLPGLPRGWAYFKTSSLCHVVRGGSPRPAGDPKYYGGSIPFLKVADLTRSAGSKLSTHTFTITEAGLSKTRLTPPETLMISNSGATLGVPKICMFEATFNDGIAAFLGIPRPYLTYLYYYWESKTNELRAVNQGAAQPNLNTTILGQMPVPVCSKAEAQEVVARLEAVLSNSGQLLSEIEARLQDATVLRQTILMRAFAGQLVAQDVRDESASSLLTSIRADSERPLQGKERGDRKGKKKAA